MNNSIQRLISQTKEGEYCDLEIELRKLDDKDYSQALIECLKVKDVRNPEDYVQCIIQILQFHQKIDFKLKIEGKTALEYVVLKGNISLLQELIKFIDNKKQLESALEGILDSNQDNWDMVDLLLEKVELKKPQYLIKSLKAKNLKTSQKLIQRGGFKGVDENGDTALHIASKEGQTDIVRELIQLDSSLLYQRNKQGEMAFQLGNDEVKFEMFMSRKKLPNLITQSTQSSAEYKHQEAQTQTKQTTHSEAQTIKKEFAEVSTQTDQPQQFEKPSLQTLILQLTNEINKLGQEFDEVQLQQKPIIEQLHKTLQNDIKKVNQKLNIKMYGSSLTRLQIPDSDVDFVIDSLDDDHMTLLYRIKDVIKGYTQQSLVIETAKGPLLRAQCKEQFNLIQIDISVENKYHTGVKSAEIMLEYQKEFKQMRYLVYALKHYLRSINLLNSYQGGLSSHALMIMIVAFLQDRRINDSENDPVGQIFHDFLELYGNNLDYFNKIIYAVLPNGHQNNNPDLPNFYQCQYLQKGTEQLLFIADPFLYTTNIATSTFRIKQIKAALSMGLSALYNAKPMNILNQIIQYSQNHVLIEQNYCVQPYYNLF